MLEPYLAPIFALPRDGGELVNSEALRPAPVVLFFYPRDATPGCTNEALDFTKHKSDFDALGVKVFGISKDTVQSHAKFIQKKGLEVALLSDAQSDVSESFGVWKEKSMYGKTFLGIERSSFLIDGAGRVVQEWRKVKVPGHVQEVLKAARELVAA